MVYFRLSTSGLTTGPPSSYTQPQSGLKPRLQAEQGSASLNIVSVSEGVASEVQNCGGLFTEQHINSFTGTVWCKQMAPDSKSCVCILFLMLWEMSLKFISSHWVQEKKKCHEKCHSLIQLFKEICGVFSVLSARHHCRHCAYLRGLTVDAGDIINTCNSKVMISETQTIL